MSAPTSTSSRPSSRSSATPKTSSSTSPTARATTAVTPSTRRRSTRNSAGSRRRSSRTASRRPSSGTLSIRLGGSISSMVTISIITRICTARNRYWNMRNDRRTVSDWTMLSSVRALSRRMSQDSFRQPPAAAFPLRGEGFFVREFCHF